MNTLELIFTSAKALLIGFLVISIPQNNAISGDSLANITHIYIPEDVQSPSGIKQRKNAQLNTRKQFQVLHDFHFTDLQPGSGLNFLHRIVDDAGKFYKAVHYDHGNGIAVADINNDGLIDVYLVSQAGPNGLYENMGNGKFKDITADAGVSVDDAIGVTASFADIDNDGDADLYVTNVRSHNRLFENTGNGKFIDISESSGLDFNGHSSAAILFDYNRDGLLDVFLTVIGQYTTDKTLEVTGTPQNEKPYLKGKKYYLGFKDAFAGHLHEDRQRTSRLYRNLGDNKFEDITEKTGLLDAGWSGDATPTDFNNDGWTDIYVLNMQGHDQYWVNNNGKTFTNTERNIFHKTPWGAMGVKSFDFDNDGDMDLLISDMHSDMSEKIGPEKEKLKAVWIEQNWSESFLKSSGKSIYGNALYRNDGDDKFTEISETLNIENYWPWGLSVADLNADGWLDVLLTSSMNYPFRYAPNSLLINNRGKKFLDAEYIVGIEPRRNQRTSKPWIQLNCSGVDKIHPKCAGQQQQLVVHGALGSRSSAIFDLDEDGDLDIITNEFGDVPQLLISNLSQKYQGKLNFIKIKLIGTQSNRDGLGARVTVHSAENSWLQINDGKSGYLSQSSMPLYFGLGDTQSIGYIEVTWPSGKTLRISDGIAVNQTLHIRENMDALND